MYVSNNGNFSYLTSLFFFPIKGEQMDRSPCKYIEVAANEECKDVAHLESFFQDVLDRGGEGIILRDPSSLLQPGRSPGFLKHKVHPPTLLPL